MNRMKPISMAVALLLLTGCATSTPTPFEVSILREWGSQGGDGQLNHPDGIAVGGSGKIYVADSHAHSVQVFSAEGEFLRMWGSRGDGDGQFNNPNGIAVDRSGKVYVADTENQRVQVFNAEGEFLAKWGSGAGTGAGTGDGEFIQPYSIAVDGSGNVYVMDSGNHRVQVFSAEGEFLGKWGSKGSDEGQFTTPHGGGVALDESGKVYVADAHNNRVQVFAIKLPSP